MLNGCPSGHRIAAAATPAVNIGRAHQRNRRTATSEGSDTTVTDTQDQIDVLSSTASNGSNGASASETPSTVHAKRRSGSLSGMLLPDLQALATSMGISTTKMRKSDIVAAIESASGTRPNAAASRAIGSAAEPDAREGDTADQTTAPASAPTRAARGRRSVSRTAGPAQPALTDAVSDAPAQAAPVVERERVDKVRDEAAADTQTRSAPQSTDREVAPRSGDTRSQRDSRPARNDRSDSRSDNRESNRDNRNQFAGSARDDDDDFAGGRRSRRYRDRRGRNRDRVDAPARQDNEPQIGEDDVLIPVAGILDAVEDKNTWFIRTGGYFASPEDVYVSNSLARRHGLRRGDAITGAVRQPREGERKEKFNPLARLDTVNGLDPEKARNRVEFTKLTPLYPQDRLRLETEPHILTTRVIDLVMPIGKGQRALVVSPPKAGKTSVLQSIANAIAVNNPECHLMVVLVDERPEEVTDMQRSVKGEVVASTFDRRPQDHTMVAELSIERAKRLVELGHDVVVLLDSITRLGRAYNLAAPASGRILSGGVDSTALYPPKRFLGAARNIEDGGSLTIIATALVETGSTMDTVIFEEFKGTGNAELILDRKIADKRVFPAVDVDKSGTRKEEILLSPDELAVVLKLRRVLHSLEPQQGIDLLLDRLKKSRTNIEFLMQIAKTAPASDDR
jgi:transcription termination factor Rho